MFKLAMNRASSSAAGAGAAAVLDVR